MLVTVTVNDREYTREIEPRTLLVHFLRDDLDLTGTHWGCDTSNCGTCVVLMDGVPVKSCTVLAATAERHQIRTVEGLEVGGVLDPVQEGFAEEHGLQCGFCTPGMMMTARALLDRQLDATSAGDGELSTAQRRRRSVRRFPVRSAGAPATRRSCVRSAGRRSARKRKGEGWELQPSFEGVDDGPIAASTGWYVGLVLGVVAVVVVAAIVIAIVALALRISARRAPRSPVSRRSAPKPTS